MRKVFMKCVQCPCRALGRVYNPKPYLHWQVQKRTEGGNLVHIIEAYSWYERWAVAFDIPATRAFRRRDHPGSPSSATAAGRELHRGSDADGRQLSRSDELTDHSWSNQYRSARTRAGHFSLPLILIECRYGELRPQVRVPAFR